jgi:hypothetical protein
VLFDVNDIHSTVLARRDLVPYSFSGPATGTVFSVMTPVRAVAVVDTADGLLRLTHQFDWQAGLGTVTVTTTITNRTSVPLTLSGYKRQVAFRPDGSGGYASGVTGNWERVTNGIGAFISCNCAPHPGPPPLTQASVSTHVLTFTGGSPSYTMIHSITDDGELYASRPVASGDLPGLRLSENDQATLVWNGSTLNPGGSRTFAVQYAQH